MGTCKARRRANTHGPTRIGTKTRARPLVSIVVPVLDGERVPAREPRLDPRPDASAARGDRHGRRLDRRDRGRSSRRTAIASSTSASPRRAGSTATRTTASRSRAASSSASSTPTTSTCRSSSSARSTGCSSIPRREPSSARTSSSTPTGREFGRLELPPEVRGNRPLDYADVLNALLTHKNAFLRCPTALVRSVGLPRARRLRPGAVQEHLRPRDVAADRAARTRSACSRSTCSSTAGVTAARPSATTGSAPTRTASSRSSISSSTSGGRAVATADALRAYEAHRAEDTLMRAVSHYILGERGAARAVLGELRLRRPRRKQRRSSAAACSLLALALRGARPATPHRRGRPPLRPPLARRLRTLRPRRDGLMCGIVGGLGAAPVDGALVERMRDRLAHRGPDAAGLWTHRRPARLPRAPATRRSST